MKIRYSKERLNSNYKLGLYFVIVGTILAIVFTIFSDSNKFELDSAGIGLIAAGIFSLVHYYYEKKKQYLTIKNGILTKNSLIPKKIKLNEIKQIKKFAGDYKLKTNESEFVIDTQIIDPNSLTKLNTELEKLNVEWN